MISSMSMPRLVLASFRARWRPSMTVENSTPRLVWPCGSKTDGLSVTNTLAFTASFPRAAMCRPQLDRAKTRSKMTSTCFICVSRSKASSRASRGSTPATSESARSRSLKGFPS